MTTALVDVPALAHADVPPRARYRADIDGLRAIAVLAVIARHAGLGGLAGGFIGVDVFFVISGYLIHRDLLRRAAYGRVSLLGFYGRRMRRTLPALFVVCSATLAAATAVMMPGDLVELARSLIGAVCLVPNILFLTQGGYFDQVAAARPLLHTWSLGVEEQFYLFAPLLVVALGRLSLGWRKTMLLGLFATSLVFCIALQRSAPDAAFFLMPARVFEFLSGAMLAEALLPAILTPALAEGLAALALGGLVISIAQFSEALPHPGWPTLLPCLSTAALIHVGVTRRTLVGRLLGSPAPAFIGLISYSLYLWHWPMLVLARYADLPMTPGWLLGGAAVLFCLSAASWRFVEQPFRVTASSWRARAPVAIPTGGAVLVATAATVIALHGLPARFPPEVASIAAYYDYRDQKPFRQGQCFITSQDRASAFDRDDCLRLDSRKPNVLLIGDSHAAHMWTGLREAWPTVNVLQATASGCKPTLGTSGAARCTQMMNDMFASFIPSHRLDALVIGGLWDEGDVAPLLRTIAAMAPYVPRIVVFGPVPRYDEPLATLLAQSLYRGDLDRVPQHLLPGVKRLDEVMRKALAPVATYISPYDALCPDGTACRVFVSSGVPMQFDYHHLTAPGAASLMAQVKREHAGLFEPHRSTSSR